MQTPVTEQACQHTASVRKCDGKVTDTPTTRCVTSVKMFKWKVSGLGGKKDKSKTQQQTRLNNEPQQAEVVEVKNNNNNNKTKDSGKKEK